MKLLITPLIVSAIVMSSSNLVYAESYSADKLNKLIILEDDNCNDQIDIIEFTDTKSAYDQNQDGYITTNEVAIKMEEDLEKTVNELRKHGVSETNINKTVTSELNSIDKESAALIKKMDSDNDGLVEPEELEVFKEKQFEQLDSNKDGVISSSDLKSKKSSPKGGFGFLYKQ